jgi:UDP-N-acetylmuramate dehydrogenase
LRLCGRFDTRKAATARKPIFRVFPPDIQLNFQENVSLARLTTLEVGGPAKYFLRAENEEQIVGGFDFAQKHGLPVFVLGGGSNVLVSDRGFEGLIIQVALQGIALNGPVVTAAAGEDWDKFVELCVSRNLAGVECLSGIPGTVGGTPVQNVGAYGQDVSETILTVRCYDRTNGKIADLSNEECGFSYRRSVFNTTERDRYVVLSVTYRLEQLGRPKIVYKDLVQEFGMRQPTLEEARSGVLRIRRSKSMVIEPDDPNRRSAGSFFKNPIVDHWVIDDIQDNFGEWVPQFAELDTKVKIPAAWLIEHAGFHKGYAMGNAGISTNHTLAIINRGRAAAAEIVALKNAIQEAVKEKFGLDLLTEPVFIGVF